MFGQFSSNTQKCEMKYSLSSAPGSKLPFDDTWAEQLKEQEFNAEVEVRVRVKVDVKME